MTDTNTEQDPYQTLIDELVDDDMTELEARKWNVATMDWRTLQQVASELGVYEQNADTIQLRNGVAEAGVFQGAISDGCGWYIRLDGESVPLHEHIDMEDNQ